QRQRRARPPNVVGVLLLESGKVLVSVLCRGVQCAGKIRQFTLLRFVFRSRRAGSPFSWSETRCATLGRSLLDCRLVCGYGSRCSLRTLRRPWPKGVGRHKRRPCARRERRRRRIACAQTAQLSWSPAPNCVLAMW